MSQSLVNLGHGRGTHAGNASGRVGRGRAGHACRALQQPHAGPLSLTNVWDACRQLCLLPKPSKAAKCAAEAMCSLPACLSPAQASSHPPGCMVVPPSLIMHVSCGKTSENAQFRGHASTCKPKKRQMRGKKVLVFLFREKFCSSSFSSHLASQW